MEEELNGNGEEFVWSNHLGYVVSDPINLGTALNVSVRVKLRRLSVVSFWIFGAETNLSNNLRKNQANFYCLVAI